MKRVLVLQSKEAAALSSGEGGSSEVDEAASGVAASMSGLDINGEGDKKDGKKPETVFGCSTAAASTYDQVSST